jgi:hypothetical protein
MIGAALLQFYEDSRGFTRDLPDADVLTLISRLVTELLVRMDGADEAVFAIGDAVGLGVGVGRSELEAQREVLAGIAG